MSDCAGEASRGPPVFVYGPLVADEVLIALFGRIPDSASATARGYLLQTTRDKRLCIMCASSYSHNEIPWSDDRINETTDITLSNLFLNSNKIPLMGSMEHLFLPSLSCLSKVDSPSHPNKMTHMEQIPSPPRKSSRKSRTRDVFESKTCEMKQHRNKHRRIVRFDSSCVAKDEQVKSIHAEKSQTSHSKKNRRQKCNSEIHNHVEGKVLFDLKYSEETLLQSFLGEGYMKQELLVDVDTKPCDSETSAEDFGVTRPTELLCQSHVCLSEQHGLSTSLQATSHWDYRQFRRVHLEGFIQMLMHWRKSMFLRL